MIVLFAILLVNSNYGQTQALWCFDEQQGIYPSCVLSDLSDNDYPLVIGPGGMIVEGKFGNGLAISDQTEVEIHEAQPGAAENHRVDIIGDIQKPCHQRHLAALPALPPIQVGQAGSLVAERRNDQAHITQLPDGQVLG